MQLHPFRTNREMNVRDNYMWLYIANPRLLWIHATWPDQHVSRNLTNSSKEPGWFWFCIHPFGVIYFYLCTIVWLHDFFFQIQLTYLEIHEYVKQLRRETATDSTCVFLETLEVDTKDKERRRWGVSGWNKDRKLCISCAWFHHFSQIISR